MSRAFRRAFAIETFAIEKRQLLLGCLFCVPGRPRARHEAGSGVSRVREALPRGPIHPAVLLGAVPEERSPSRDRRRSGRAARRESHPPLRLRPLREARHSDRPERQAKQVLLRPVRAPLLEAPPHEKSRLRGRLLVRSDDKTKNDMTNDRRNPNENEPS